MDVTTLLTLAVLFLATLVRATFGFGEALVAVPLLALLLPVKVAAPMAVLVSVTVAAVVVAQDWRLVDTGSAGRLLLATILGVPLGLLLLTSVQEAIVQAVLAVLLLAFATYSLAKPYLESTKRRSKPLGDDRWGWLFGFGAGVLGGAYGMNGPPLVVYGTLRRWPPGRFRATLQGYYLPASLAGLGGYWFAGLWTPAITRYYLLSLPVMAGGIMLGSLVNRRVDTSSFQRYIYVFLFLIGLLLLAQSLW